MLELDRESFGGAVRVGAALLRAKKIRVEEMCKRARWGMLGGYRVPYVNVSWDFSDVGEYLVEKHGAPFAAYYLDREDGMRQWGMRSSGEVSVRDVAEEFGGGGHHGAAGMQTPIGWLPPETS